MADAIEKYNLTAENIYNWDEKGFLLGIANITQRIMTRAALESGRIISASQDGSRKFLSLLACIAANGIVLPPALIYKSEALQDSWLEDMNTKDETFVVTSATGWSSDEIGFNWLDQVFDRCIRKKAGNERRLLIVNGHSSHVNMAFINRCDQLRILLLILPPHSIHRLQPLDVDLFSPLSIYYTESLNNIMFNNLGAMKITKRMFYAVFMNAWKKAFTCQNITSAFQKIGIFLYNPSILLNVIKKPKPVASENSSSIKTPMNNHSTRHMHKIYKKRPSPFILAKILRANERFAAEHAINQHIIKGLSLALQDEKRRRRRGKRLDMLGDEDSGPRFFSPSKVQAARERLEAVEAEKVQKQQKIEGKKASAAANKKQKELEKAERARIAAENKMLNAELRAYNLTEKPVAKGLKNKAPEDGGPGSASMKSPTKLPPSKNKGKNRQLGVEIADGVDETERVDLVTARGRRVQRPSRFDL